MFVSQVIVDHTTNRLKKIQEKKEIQRERDAKAKAAWGISQGDTGM